jgi:phosphatidylglycerol:prolipoprotein diacylglycerol transferase
LQPIIFKDHLAYQAFLALSVLTGVCVFVYRVRSRAHTYRQVGLTLLVLVSTAIAGAKIYSLVENGAVGTLQAELAGGYRQPGLAVGALTGLIALSLYFRGPRYALAIGDIGSPALLFAIAVFRIGCFLNGCCHGTLSNSFLALRYPRGSRVWNWQLDSNLLQVDSYFSLPVHPLPLYFSVLAVVTALILCWIEPRKRFTGEVLLVCLATHGLGKFALEFLRDPPVTHVRVFELGSGLIGALGLVIGLSMHGLQDTVQREEPI